MALFAATTGASMPYYALELRGGSRIYALDEPVRKGRVVLFHRFPDGSYLSLASSEVTGVVALERPPVPQTEALAPGQELVLGPLSGPVEAPAAGVATGPPAVYPDSGYGYSGSYWGGGGAGVRPPVPPSVPPSRIGPNGFPILAAPGTPGSTSPPIGPNGFPILAPRPQAPPPRARPM